MQEEPNFEENAQISENIEENKFEIVAIEDIEKKFTDEFKISDQQKPIQAKQKNKKKKTKKK